MNRAIYSIVALVFAALLVALSYYFVGNDDPITGPQETAPPIFEDFEEVEDEVIPAPVTPPPPTPIPLRGRILRGRDLRPDPELVVLLDDRQIALSANGTFALPPSIRTSRGVLTCQRNSEEIARWDDIILGGMLDSLNVPTELAPSSPTHIDLTVLTFEPLGSVDGFSIEPSAILVEEWGIGGRIRTLGHTNLPDGAHVAASLYFDRHRDLSTAEPGRVTDSRFTVTIWSEGKEKLFSGRYQLHLAFNQTLETPANIDTWALEFSDLPWNRVGGHSVETDIVVGDPTVAAQEDRTFQAYYGLVLSKARILKAQLSTRVREIRRLGRGWNPEYLAERLESRQGWFHEEFVGADGKLNEELWRDFLDRRWRPQAQEVLERHMARGPQKYQAAEGRVRDLYDSLLRQSRAYSLFVIYPLFGLKQHSNDFYQDDSGVGDLTVLERRIHDHFEQLERYTRLVGTPSSQTTE